MSKLNPKQTKFVQEYLTDLSATKAAIRAGYSKRTAGSQAHDLLKKPEIQKLIRELMEKRSEKTAITQIAVVTRIDDAASRAKQAGDLPNELRALELLGKHVGAFTERLQIGGNLSNLPDEEIERRIQQKIAARSGAS